MTLESQVWRRPRVGWKPPGQVDEGVGAGGSRR